MDEQNKYLIFMDNVQFAQRTSYHVHVQQHNHNSRLERINERLHSANVCVNICFLPSTKLFSVSFHSFLFCSFDHFIKFMMNRFGIVTERRGDDIKEYGITTRD